MEKTKQESMPVLKENIEAIKLQIADLNDLKISIYDRVGRIDNGNKPEEINKPGAVQPQCVVDELNLIHYSLQSIKETFVEINSRLIQNLG